ncbi:unnamed protein product [Durusdinium trenchii]|uniref:DUF7869 domain-containing protein n=1 Tax=Durusdinium trenchii TaxID=1381693 RepID=A0ABP0Q3W6_9DINO
MQDVDQRGGLTLSGHPVCQRAWRLLLGVGKSRFTRLRNAIVQGRADPPGDGRYGVKRHTTLIPSDGARAAVHEYLTKLYHSTAEPLPEGRQAEDAVEITNRARRVKRRGKRPRHFVKREERSSGFAPTVWEENFRDHLVIRPKSQHKACSLCIRYKLLLRRLQYQPEAKAEQMRLYRAHLEKQYADRTTYWGSRALSRMGLQSTGERLIVLTLDSVDHAKFAVPRDLSMQSKCFSNFVRPSLCCTGVLIHGYGVVLVLGQPFTRQDSSWTCDIIGYCLNLLSQLPPDQCNLPASSIILQGDNSSKELKNNSVMRLLSGAVACRRVQKAQLRTLQAGHSHEDLDQFFSSLCDRISSSSSLHTPTDFVDNLQSWLATVRPLEPMKKVVLLDQESLQRVCGAWIHAVETMKGQLPDDFTSKELPQLQKGFLLKYADIELQAALDGAVPPIKVESISVLRPVLFKFQREAQLVFFWVALRVYKFARLQEQIAAVDLKKLETNIAKDLESMTKWAKSCADESNRNAHLDLKYLNARYEKGVRLVDEFMQKRHEYKDSTIGLATAQPDILRFMTDNEAGPQGTLRRTVVLPRIESRSFVRCLQVFCAKDRALDFGCHVMARAFPACSQPVRRDVSLNVF